MIHFFPNKLWRKFEPKKVFYKHALVQLVLEPMKDLLLVVSLKLMVSLMMLPQILWFTELTDDVFIVNNPKLVPVDQITKEGKHGRLAIAGHNESELVVP